MLNSIETYRENGRKAGLAARRHDAALVRHLSGWQRRAEALETPEDRIIAQQAYREAYSAEATPSMHLTALIG